jgi:hypothetical protein
LQDDDVQALPVEEGVDIFTGVEQEAVAKEDPADQFEGNGDQHQSQQHVEFLRAGLFGGVIGKPPDAVRCLRHVVPFLGQRKAGRQDAPPRCV